MVGWTVIVALVVTEESMEVQYFNGGQHLGEGLAEHDAAVVSSFVQVALWDRHDEPEASLFD